MTDGPVTGDLFAAALADVQPLAPRCPQRVRASRPAAARKTSAGAPPGASARFHLERTGERVTGWRGELPPRELGGLGGDTSAIEATLDLHGLATVAARERLASFLEAARRRGARTVLVITGHGRHRPGAGALRREVPEWLAAPPLARLLVAFVTARWEHGGAGALYVRLSPGARERTPAARLL